jgi:hypothetical protein
MVNGKGYKLRAIWRTGSDGERYIKFWLAPLD